MIRIMAAAPAAGLPGDVLQNEAEIARLIDEAKAAEVQLLILPELCLTGAGCGDLFEYGLLTDAAQRAALRLARRCEDICCVFGLPLQAEGRVYSAMLAARDGQFLGCWLRDIPSSYTARAVSFRQEPVDIHLPGAPIEDMTGRSLIIGEEKLAVSFAAADDIPAAAAGFCAEGATVLAFPAVHGALADGSAHKERQALKAARSGCLCACVSGGYNESSTDWVTDGLALIASPDGRLSRGRPFAFEAALCPEDLRPRVFSETDERPDPIHPYAPPAGPQLAAWCREAMEICAHALRLRMERAGAATALIGLSGGLDSAMALVTACRAFDMMGRDKSRGILAYALPGFGSGEKTRGNARRLSEALGVSLKEIDIRAAVSCHLEDIGHDGRHDAAYENAQARERTQILMDLANMHGGLMLGPGDLSELALGFTTYGGDHLSMYCLNSGLYKSAVRLILKQLAEDNKGLPLEEALLSILDTPVSPELLPAEQGEISQRTEDIVGPYELNDFYLHHFLQGRSSPEALLSLAISAFGEKYGRKELLARMESLFRRFFAAQFKRSCLPDGPMVLGLSLSPRGGWQMPSDASAALWLKEVDRLREIYAAAANA